LERASWIVVDKVTTVWRSRIGATFGRLAPAEMQRLNGALAVFLGIG
jgi:mRNA-degrading endonuclease toxin of MazEF toxin-antitoxin module